MKNFLSINSVTEDVAQFVQFKINNGWDYVWVTFSDAKGFISITSSYGNWSYIWSSMGEGVTLREFFSSAGESYLAAKLFGHENRDIFNTNDAVKDIKDDIMFERRGGYLSKEKARLLWNEIKELGDYYQETSRDIFLNAFKDNRALVNWCPDWWENKWGLRNKPNFLTLHNEIIPMIKHYFKGELKLDAV